MKRWNPFGRRRAPGRPEGEPVDLPAPSVASATDAGRGGGRVLPWEAVAPSRGQRVMRATVTAGVAFFALIGAVRTFAPRDAPQAAASMEVPQSAGADRAAAASVAEQIAIRYLSLDDSKARTRRLEGVWKGAGTAGWDGAGHLSVSAVYTARTTAVSRERVDVLVAAFITNADNEAQASVSGWVGVLVPIQFAGESVSAAGEPAIVGLPAPAPAPTAERKEVDTALSAETKSGAATFVAAWAGGDATALAAPGADIPAPSLTGASASLDEWRVATGEGDTRTAQAAITWTLGDAKVRVQYAVTITRVASGDASRWQISSITTTTKEN